MIGTLPGDESVHLVKPLRHFPPALGIHVHGHLKRGVAHPALQLLGSKAPMHHQRRIRAPQVMQPDTPKPCSVQCREENWGQSRMALS